MFMAELLRNNGYCDICEKPVLFSATDPWLRDYYKCELCGSIPRERAVMLCLQRFFPNWRELIIHESSPISRGPSVRLRKECPGYIPTQFWTDVRPGRERDGVRCENLEALTFRDHSIDLHITQDVLEHVFHPSRAFAEIARTLRPGGAHIFTTPLVNKTRPSELCAQLRPDGSILHLMEPEYHGNPVNAGGALLTVRWGFDICRHIHDACGLFTQVIEIDNLERGIRAEYMEVLITWKFQHGSSLQQKAPSTLRSLVDRIRQRGRRHPASAS
jgi:SAM-dependent methyltransferase